MNWVNSEKIWSHSNSNVSTHQSPFPALSAGWLQPRWPRHTTWSCSAPAARAVVPEGGAAPGEPSRARRRAAPSHPPSSAEPALSSGTAALWHSGQPCDALCRRRGVCWHSRSLSWRAAAVGSACRRTRGPATAAAPQRPTWRSNTPPGRRSHRRLSCQVPSSCSPALHLHCPSRLHLPLPPRRGGAWCRLGSDTLWSEMFSHDSGLQGLSENPRFLYQRRTRQPGSEGPGNPGGRPPGCHRWHRERCWGCGSPPGWTLGSWSWQGAPAHPRGWL